MNFVFDFDGTLFDTYPAVLAAYREVGVEPPADFFGKPWRTWLPTVVGGLEEAIAARQNKEAAYVRHAAAARPLPSLAVYQHMLQRGHNCVILTGAGKSAVQVMFTHHAPNLWSNVPANSIHVEQTLWDKYRYLKSLRYGTYFDDDEDAVRFLAEKLTNRWTIQYVQTPRGL